MTNPSCVTRVIRGSLTQAILAWTYSFTSLIDPFHTHSKRISGKQHGVTLSKVGSSSGLNVRQRMGQLLPTSSLGLPQELARQVHNDVGCSNVLLAGFEGARVKVLPATTWYVRSRILYRLLSILYVLTPRSRSCFIVR